MQPGRVILLNGTSSAGKSSILKALQEVLDEPWLDMGMDRFLFTLPRRYLSPPLWGEVFEFSVRSEVEPAELRVEAGPLGHRLMSGMHHVIAAMARQGLNVVADHVLSEPAWLRECAELFQALPAYFIGVRCPLEVAEQRERGRRNRTLGHARAHFEQVHAHGCYDLEVDSSVLRPQESALLIQQRLQAGPPRAFRELAERFRREGE
jgi:chloramphenicol 3-O phosphotransferase